MERFGETFNNDVSTYIGFEEGGESTRRRVAVLTALVTIGAVLLVSSIYVGAMIGSQWFGTSGSSPWHMNNYIVVQAKYAYAYFGLAALAIGGLATGIAASSLLSSIKSMWRKFASACSFFSAIVLTGLGFNTLDFMLGCFYWTNMQYPPPVSVPVLGFVDVWNYYFFLFVVPLWLGGFIMGVATSYFAFVYYPKHLGASISANRKFGKVLRRSIQTAANVKEYVVETGTFSRKFKQDLG